MTDEVTHAKLSTLTPDARNANQGTERGAAMLETSLRKHGAGRSILLDKSGRVIAGNKTLQQASDIGIDDVLIVHTTGDKLVAVQRDDLDLADDDTGARAMAYADNRTSEIDLSWDPAVIFADMQAGVPVADFWTDDELAELLTAVQPTGAGGDTEAAIDIDRAAELQAEWSTAVGQVWALGPHRLAIGDCTDPAAVEAVMRGERAAMCVTSPPYSVGKEYETGDVNDWLRLIEGLFDNIPSNVIWINLANKRTGNDGFERNTFFELSQIAEAKQYGMIGLRVWVKDPTWAGQHPYWRQTYKPVDDFEFIALFASEKPKHKNRLPDEQNNEWGYRGVWDFGSVSKNSLHSAAYPVELPERCMKLTSDPDGIIYDPFVGSGTTIIAAHNLNRKARACELDIGYAAVCLDRFQRHTNQEPRLL